MVHREFRLYGVERLQDIWISDTGEKMRFHNEEDQDSIDIITPYSVFSLILLLFRFLKPIKS